MRKTPATDQAHPPLDPGHSPLTPATIRDPDLLRATLQGRAPTTPLGWYRLQEDWTKLTVKALRDLTTPGSGLHETIVYLVLWRACNHTQGQHVCIPPIEWGQALTHDTDINVTRRGTAHLRRAPAEKDHPGDPNRPEQWEQATALNRDTALRAAGLRTPDNDPPPPPTDSDHPTPEVWVTVLERGHYYVIAATATSPGLQGLVKGTDTMLAPGTALPGAVGDPTTQHRVLRGVLQPGDKPPARALAQITSGKAGYHLVLAMPCLTPWIQRRWPPTGTVPWIRAIPTAHTQVQAGPDTRTNPPPRPQQSLTCGYHAIHRVLSCVGPSPKLAYPLPTTGNAGREGGRRGDTTPGTGPNPPEPAASAAHTQTGHCTRQGSSGAQRHAPTPRLGSHRASPRGSHWRQASSTGPAAPVPRATTH